MGQNANKSLLEAHFPAGQFERLGGATMNDGAEIVISDALRPLPWSVVGQTPIPTRAK
jgi:hypothetical protein